MKTTVLGGLFAVAGALGGAAVTGWSQVQLARHEFNSELVLKALESSSPEQRLKALQLLVETNLLKDPEVKRGVREYAEARMDDPSSVPQIGAFESPTIQDPRIFLLAGTASKDSLFDSFQRDLQAAGFRVLGAKAIQDEGRPDGPEIRYFFAEDRVQAERIAEVVRFRLAIEDMPVTPHQDPDVRPGYIEIWFGR